MIRKSLILLLVILSTVSAIPSSVCQGSLDKTIVIVSSYNPVNPCGELQLEGIIKGIRNDAQFKDDFPKVVVLYLLSRSKNVTIYSREEAAKKIMHRIFELHPLKIFITDDAAFEFVAIPLLKKHIQVYFSGLNIPLDIYKARDPELCNMNLIGIQEIVSAKELRRFLVHIGFRVRYIYILYDPINVFSYYVEQDIRKAFSDEAVTSNLIENRYQLSNFFRSYDLKRSVVVLLTLSLKDTNDYYEIVSLAKQNNIHRAIIVSISELTSCKSDLVLTTDFTDMGYRLYNLSLQDHDKQTILKSKPVLMVNTSSHVFRKQLRCIENLRYVEKYSCGEL